MAQPLAGPATVELVKEHLQMAAGDQRFAATLARVTGAANAFARGTPKAQDVEADEWPADVVLGATMLAARLFRRRDTPQGVATFGDNAALYVQRTDPDVALLLGLGEYGRPAVG